MPSCFMRRPCAGRHLLFFAAAKKSRQKKAAHTASSCSCLRAPNGSYASHGGVSVQRMLPTLRMSASPASNTHAWASGSEWYVPPRWQTVCRLSRRIAWRSCMEVCARYRVRSEACVVLRPTHSLPHGRQRNIWHGTLQRGRVEQVRRSFNALASSMSHVIAV
jgi:hypothetical protein